MEANDRTISAQPVVCLNFERPLTKQYCTNAAEFATRAANFTKGTQWSPDGTCLLAATEDKRIALFELPHDATDRLEGGSNDDSECTPICPALDFREGECIYDFAWYPTMSSGNPDTSCFATTTRDHPIHLWDAYTGKIRCTYRAHDGNDELTTAISLAFNPGGTLLYAGYKRVIRVFDLSRPGLSDVSVSTFDKHAKTGVSGILSCLAFAPGDSGLFAAGSYDRTIGVYSEIDHANTLFHLGGHEGGVTQVKFSLDGTLLISGGRKDNWIHVWDLRKTGDTLYRFPRVVTTNQKIQFDVDISGRFLFTPSQDERLVVYDIQTGAELLQQDWRCDANALSIHPVLPLLAVGTGRRSFPQVDSDEDEVTADQAAAMVSIWRIDHFVENSEQ